MKRKVLASILAVMLVFLWGGVVIADTSGQTKEEIHLSGASYCDPSDNVTQIFCRGAENISVMIQEGAEIQLFTLFFGPGNGKRMDQSTIAVSGGAVTCSNGAEIFSGIVGDINGDNSAMMLTLVCKNALEGFTSGTYEICIPAGTISGKSQDGEFYVNHQITISLRIVKEGEEVVLDTPKLYLTDGAYKNKDKLSWSSVPGADYYEVQYYVDGKKAFNGHVNIPADMSDPYRYLQYTRNFPLEKGKEYSVEVTAYPAEGSMFLKSETAKLIIREKDADVKCAEKPNHVKWLSSNESKDDTILSCDIPNNLPCFVRIYKDNVESGEKTLVFASRSTGSPWDLGERMKEEGIYYAEVCTADIGNPNLASSEWTADITTSVGDKKQYQESINKILGEVTTEMDKATLETISGKLVNNGLDIFNDMLMSNDSTVRANYKKLDEAAEKAYNVKKSVESSIGAIAQKDVKVTGLAINAPAGGNVKLTIKPPATKVDFASYWKVNDRTAVQVDIDVEGITSLKHPVMITIPIPAGLSTSRLVVLHENKDSEGKTTGVETIFPINNGDGTITFSVTHFSTFAIANETTTTPNRPSGSGSSSSSRPSSSGSSSSSSSTVTAAVLQTNEKPGRWAENASGKWFSFTDKTYPVSKWLQVNGKWYYFNEDGYMAEGWKMVNSKWYYLDADNGDMAEGWKVVDGKWYYLNPGSGDMAEGWKVVDGKWYYLNPGDGAMAEGWKVVNGKWYYLNPGSGDMAEGWKIVKGKWYYLNPGKGDMATGRIQVKDKWYYLTSDGDCLMNTMTPDGYKADENGVIPYKEK